MIITILSIIIAAVCVGLVAGSAPLPMLLIALVALLFTWLVRNRRRPELLLCGALVVVVLGQLGRVPPLSGEILVLDGVMAFFFLIWHLQVLAGTYSLSKHHAVYTLLGGFLVVALITLALTPIQLSRTELIQNSFYWVRLLMYASVIRAIPTIVQSKKAAQGLLRWFEWCGLVVILLGFLQLILIPNIGFLNKYGWDPHVGRLVSTFLDPNYLGGYLALILAVVLSRTLGEGRCFPWLQATVILVAGVLTYSRSGYLAIALVVFAFGLRYSWKIFLIALVCVTPLALTIPRVRDRVMGGFQVDTTAQDRVQSWETALSVIERFPVLGIGYNNYKTVQQDLGIRDATDTSNAAAGSDSSVLNVEATTGALGLALFLATAAVLLRRAFLLTKRTEQSVRRSAAFALLLVTPALAVHAMFVNSLFYPFILLPLTVICGLVMLPEPKYLDDH